MSTVSPRASRELAERVRERGATCSTRPSRAASRRCRRNAHDHGRRRRGRLRARRADPARARHADPHRRQRPGPGAQARDQHQPRRPDARLLRRAAARRTRRRRPQARGRRDDGEPDRLADAEGARRLVLDLPDDAWFDVEPDAQGHRARARRRRRAERPAPVGRGAPTRCSRTRGPLGYEHRDLAALFEVLARFDRRPLMRSRWLILALIGVAQLMVVLDATIVNIALPSAQKALGFSDDARQWIVTAYALAFGSLLLLGGRSATSSAASASSSSAWSASPSPPRSAASPRASACSSARARCRARSPRCSRRPRWRLLTTTFTDPAERDQAFGVFGVIAGCRRRRRPDPRRRADRVPRLALEPVRQPVPRASRPPSARCACSPTQTLPQRPRIDIARRAARRPPACSRSSSASPTPRPTAGARPRRSARLAAGVALLAAFVASSAASTHPLLPLRVVADRARGGSFLAVAIVGAGSSASSCS